MAVMSIFNIGTGHTQKERNNTMRALYDECYPPKYINDGPTGLKGVALGWGMNDMLKDTMKEIRKVKPDQVNLAGHSRGAILCHMIAHAILTDNSLPNTKVTLCLIDPVHMSKIDHAGAEDLLHSDRLLAYQAIIMENENTNLKGGPGGKLYPLTFINLADDDDGKKLYYINMPGTHGSATQVLTNPIAKVAKELIKNFMRKRGSFFKGQKPTPVDMCELFAQIHLLNPFSHDFQARLIYNDPGKAKVHKPGNESWQSVDSRAASVSWAYFLNEANVPGRIKVANLQPGRYLINQKHAKFFSRAFPSLWIVLSSGTHIPRAAYEGEMAVMFSRPALKQTLPMLWKELQSAAS